MKKILALLMAMLMLTGAAFAEAPALQSFTLTADSSVEMDLDGADYQALYYGTLAPEDDEQLQAGLQLLLEKIA